MTNAFATDLEPAATNTAAEIADKKGYGARWSFSVRTVDNLLAQGLPHLKIGQRRVRILVSEADAWMHQRFGQQRIGRAKAKTAQPQAA
jgi:hypothetical protein